MSEESQLKSELVRQCKAMGWYARRIEDGYGVGILDVIIVPSKHPTLFVEGKVTDGIKFAPTERQYIEGMRIIQAAGQALPILVGWRQETMYIANWGSEAFITKAYRQPDRMNYAQTIKEWLDGRQEHRS
jgi:hypothetical protein